MPIQTQMSIVITMAATMTIPTVTPINMYRFIHEAPVLVGGELVSAASLVTAPEAGMMVDSIRH